MELNSNQVLLLYVTSTSKYFELYVCSLFHV